MKVFVYFADGYGKGGIGLEAFDYREDAAAFILKRMSEDPDRTLDQYTVIEGRRLEAKPMAVVTQIRLD
jgi:hypothetical protein